MRLPSASGCEISRPLAPGKTVLVVLSADIPPPELELVRNDCVGSIRDEVVRIPGGQFMAKTIGLARKIAADWANRNIKGSFNNKDTGWAIAVGLALGVGQVPASETPAKT